MADFGVCWRLMFSYFHGLVYMSSLSSMLSLDYIKTWYQLPEAAGIYIYIYIFGIPVSNYEACHSLEDRRLSSL